MKLFLTSIFSKVAEKLLPLLDKNPKDVTVGFIPTASNFYKVKPWIDTDRNKLIELGFQVKDIDLEMENVNSLKEKLNKIDIIFFAGGNTTYLLQKVKESGFESLLDEFASDNKIFVGSSAGSIIAGPSVEPYLGDEIKELPTNFVLSSPNALSIINFVISPHYNQEKYKMENDKVLKNFGNKYKIKTLNDNQVYIINGAEPELITVE